MIFRPPPLLESNYNLLLINLCCSNVVCAVLTKSISVVHMGYAVAAGVVESHMAFCLIYIFRLIPQNIGLSNLAIMNVLQLQTHMGHPALVSGGNVLASNY